MTGVRRHNTVVAAVVALAMTWASAACGGEGGAGPANPGGTSAQAYTPAIDPSAFSSTVDNPYYPLRPGMTWEYRSETAYGVETTVVTVTSNTKTIMGVPCVEVRDTVKLDGEVKEDTLDWFAQQRDGTVWYFGEDTKEYRNGKVTSTAGSWEGGVDGAYPGIVMPAQPMVGNHYRQEYYAGKAEDMADVLSITATATVPTGNYTGVVQTKDYTPLEPDVLEHKYYARGVGVVLTVDTTGGGTRDELVRFTG